MGMLVLGIDGGSIYDQSFLPKQNTEALITERVEQAFHDALQKDYVELAVTESTNALHEPFYELRLTEKDKDNIEFIVSNLGKLGYFSLLRIQPTLRQKEKELEPVHPMRFIAHILADPTLRRNLKEIKKDFFKWNEFVRNFENDMINEAEKGNLSIYTPGFSDLLKLDLHKVQEHIQKKNYSALIAI